MQWLAPRPWRRECLAAAAALVLGGCGGNGAAPAVAPGAGQGSPDAALQTPVQVRVTAVRRGDLQQEARVSGVLSAFRKATVAAETAGRVVQRAAEPGQQVAAGQVLVVLDAERARFARDQAEASLHTRKVAAEQAESELNRGRDLFERKFISPDRLDALSFAAQRAHSEVASAAAQLATTRRALADTSVRAPFAGIAEEVHVQVGDYLKVGVPVATVADFSRVRVRAGVTASEAELLAESGVAEVALDALGGRRLLGEVNSVGRISDPATGTYAVEIWLDGGQAALREGMLATVHLPYAAGPSRPVTPSAAVFRRKGALHVFVVREGHVHLRPVRTGRTNGALVEVLEGLSDNELVVIDGQFALRDGAPVTVVDQS